MHFEKYASTKQKYAKHTSPKPKINTKTKQTQEKAHPILQREHETHKIASSTETQECEASFL